MTQEQELTQRQQARAKFEATIIELESYHVLTREMLRHYRTYLAENEKYGETDTSKMQWDPLYNHRAKAGDQSAIEGTRNEMIVSAVLGVLHDAPVHIETDKTMQMYGRDLIQGKRSYSVKHREHEALAPGGFLLRLEKSDFKPGQFRVTKIVYVDDSWITFINYRPLARFCTTIVNNIPVEVNKSSLYTKEFETKFPSDIAIFSLQNVWEAWSEVWNHEHGLIRDLIYDKNH